VVYKKGETKMTTQQRVKYLTDNLSFMEGDDLRCALIQLRTLLPKPTKTLYIDADSLIYYIAFGNSGTAELEGSFVGNEHKTTFKDYKIAFKSLVHSVVNDCEIESFKKKLPRFKDYKLVFTVTRNFRYDIYPEYKANRKDMKVTVELLRLKKWVLTLDEAMWEDGLEADDKIYDMAMQGHPVASPDKDIIYQVPACYNYHPKHKCVVTNTPEEMNRFLLLQTLCGDSTDNIIAIKGVGMKTAEKLLGDGDSLDDVIKIYESKGLTKEECLLNYELVRLGKR
jgi:hypothetical protein